MALKNGRRADRGSAPRGLSAFLLSGCLAGCGVQRPPAAPPPAGPVSGYVNPERYLSLHPAAADLAALDEQARRLERHATAAAPPIRPIETPQPVPLPSPEPPPAPAAPRGPDRERARQAIREEYEIAAAAEPDRAGEAFYRELARLRRRYEELRDVVAPADEQRALEEAARRADELARLRSAVRALVPHPTDPLLYRPEEIRQRQQELLKLQKQVDALQTQERERLAKALQRPVGRRRPAIPPELIARAEEERHALRARAADELARRESKDLDAVRQAALPPPMPGQVASPQELAPVAPPAELAVLAARPAPPAAREPRSDGQTAALRRQRQELRAVMLEDVRAAALAAGKASGIQVTFRAGEAPERTQQLLPTVRRRLVPVLARERPDE